MTGHFESGTTALLSVVQSEIESSIAAHGHARGPRPEGWCRPFLETATAIRDPFPEIQKEITNFPTKDESVGEVMLGFRGPPPMAFLERMALDLLSTYLTSSSAAPLTKEFVDIEKPMWCVASFNNMPRPLAYSGARSFSTYISISVSCVYATAVDIVIRAGAVPTEHTESFDENLRASLRRIADEGLDMDRISMILARDERQVRLDQRSISLDVSPPRLYWC